MKRILIVLTFALAGFATMAQFTVSGEFRTRGEYRNGYRTIPTDQKSPLSVVGQRTRLNLSFKKNKLSTYISLQDARIWGEDQWKTDNYGTGLYEGWIHYKFSKKTSMKIGRQKVVYDDARLFASGNWRTYGESHDMARFMFQNSDKTLKLHIGAAVNNDPDAEKGAFVSDYSLKTTQYKNMIYAWLNKSWENGLKFSFTAVRDGFQKADEILNNEVVQYPDQINYRNTVGPYIAYDSETIAFSSAYYYQTGTTPPSQDLKANFYSLRGIYKFSKSTQVMVGYDHYSGTDFSDPDAANESNTFSTLYGPGHKYLGYMDYFGKPEKHGAGINDLLARAKFKVKKAGAFEITIHQFNLDQETLMSGNQVNKNLGQEIDVVYKRKLDQNVVLVAGVSKLFYTESMEMLKGVNPGNGNGAHFGWLMLSVTPNFFSSNN